MAIIEDPDENLINQNQTGTPEQVAQGGVGTVIQPAKQTAQGGALISNSSGVNNAPSIGGTPNSTGIQNQANPSSSGLFTNLQNYLGNNADNASGLGSNVSNFFTNTAGSARNTLGSNTADFDNQIGAGTINYNEDLANNALSNPVIFNQNAANLGSYQNMVNGTYSGPSDFATSQNYANAYQPIQQYDQYVSNLDQPNQYSNLLSSIYQGQAYTPGQLSLDASLLATPNVISGVRGTVGSIGSLDDDLKNATTTENANIAKGQATTGSTNAKALQGVLGSEGNLQNTIGSNTTAAQNAAQGQYQNIQAALDQYNGYTPAQKVANPLTDDQLGQLGITSDQWNGLLKNVGQWNTQFSPQYPVFGSLNQYYSNAGTSGINTNNVATQGDYGTLGAYQNLLGNSSSNGNNFLTDPAAAGTAPKNIGSFDYGNALQTVTNDISSASHPAAAASGGGGGGSSTLQGLAQAAQVVAAVAAIAGGCSDKRLKRNIKSEGFENNLPIYSFNYFWDKSRRYVGVMAQDIIKVNPKAVKKLFGFYRVCYHKIGIKMRKIDNA